MLLNGRKFDIRSYVLITPDGSIHMYNKSYVRTSSRHFSLEDLSDRSTHLTNDAIQVKFDGYGAFEDSNKLTMQQLQDQMGAAINIEAAIIPQMQECARHAFAAVQDKLNPQKHSMTFELYGLDFMIDLSGKVYLIEVNNCPALYRHGQILTEMLPLVIEEVAQKAIDGI
ncbi:hypothetical protein WJX84_007520 [Apatococcus fuscideae]|uniref:Uncharacterized protein n=1 Tax=Apatococcus fuscideae TaxID=2026836 RepID=A0AAW1STV1_9CHLO